MMHFDQLVEQAASAQEIVREERQHDAVIERQHEREELWKAGSARR
jgi:hypothetical protein